MATPERPLSPFMIGPYYRPQLTSVLSILHRAAGVVLALAAIDLVLWLLAAAFADAGTYQRFADCAASLPGRIAAFVVSACLIYHFLNGIRHLFWDAGHGYEMPKVYASGYAVVVLTFVLTAGLWWFALGGAA